MAEFFLPCLAHLEYKEENHEVRLHYFDSAFEKMNLTHKQVVLNYKDLNQLMHLYDLKKLRYFAEQKEHQSFDFQLRLKKDDKSYIRTKAICQKNSLGYVCIIVDDFEIHQLYQKHHHINILSEISFQITNDDSIFEVKTMETIKRLKKQLDYVVKRDSI